MSGPDPSGVPIVTAAHRKLPASGWVGVAAAIGIGLASFVAQWVTIMTWVPPAQISTVWVSGGLMLAIALLTEPSRWPLVLTAAGTGAGLLYMTLGLGGLRDTLVFALLFCAITVTVAVALRAVLRRPFALATLREFLTYLIIAIVGGAVLASSLFVAVTRGLGYPATFLHWRTLALAVMLGYLTMTPTVVLLANAAKSLRSAPMQRWLEASLLSLLLALVSGLVFSGTVSRSVTWTGFAMMMPPLLLWAAGRFGRLGASAALLLVSVISTVSTSRGLGPFGTLSAGDNTLSLQLFILGTGLPLLGLAVVLSEQRRTHAALQTSHARLQDLSRELIAAREEEGARIARELHDDVGQRLALVSMGLSRLRHASADAAGHATDIAQLQEQASAVGRSLRQISHHLHPPELEHVGLSRSIQHKCQEVREATGLDVRLVDSEAIPIVPPNVALCLYRVAQEGLNNVVRHAGARRVNISLRCRGEELLLEIADDGRGFTPSDADHGGALGLRSAAERVQAVGGSLTVESAAGQGTTLRVTVPLKKAREA